MGTGDEHRAFGHVNTHIHHIVAAAQDVHNLIWHVVEAVRFQNALPAVVNIIGPLVSALDGELVGDAAVRPQVAIVGDGFFDQMVGLGAAGGGADDA